MKTWHLAVIVALAAFIGAFSGKVFANHQPEVDKIFTGKVYVYIGTCYVDARGDLQVAETPKQVECFVGADPVIPEIHYVGFMDGEDCIRITTFNTKTKETKVIWRKGQLSA